MRWYKIIQQWDYHISSVYYMSDGENIIGTFTIQEMLNSNILNSLYINIDYRNKGYGSIMMCKVLEEAKNIGINSLELKVKKTNDVAIKLYKKYGFIDDVVDYDERFIWLKKELGI